MSANSKDRGGNLAASLGWTFTAFGLTVRSDVQMLGAIRRFEQAGSGDIQVRQADVATVSADWENATCLLERHLPDGTLGMRVQRRDGYGYRVHAPGHGDFVISETGAQVRWRPADEAGWLWHRPLFGQVLPLAATLQGLELIHASAVVFDGSGIAFTGRSGAGKTSLAAHLAGRGAGLLTDDVLSLECRGNMVMANRGAPMANVAAEQLESMSPAARVRLGRRVGQSEKVHIEPACMPEQAVPLERLYFVDRGDRVDSIRFEPLDPPDPRELLGTTFMPHVVTPERLMSHLHTCSEISRSVSSFRLLSPWEVPATALAEAVERHAGNPAAA